jgi:allantoicase
MSTGTESTSNSEVLDVAESVTGAKDVNLASRALGAGVVYANDESFGEKENLVLDAPADFKPGVYGHKGEIVDGWETRRRGTSGHDWALIRLGSPGIISSVDVDTSFFTGNYPQSCTVEACGVEGYPSAEQLEEPGVPWEPIVGLSALKGDSHNVFPVRSDTRFTHIRLTIHPDGGVARLRVHGQVCPDPQDFDGLTPDLAARGLGGVVELSSDDFYSSAEVLNLPGLALNMGDGWETQRRRGDGNDWAILRLAAAGRIRMIEVDTSYYKYNASKEFSLFGCCAVATPAAESSEWQELIPRTALQPDTRHRFPLAADTEVTHLRFDVFPDGGISRLRVLGHIEGAGRRKLALTWFNALPRRQAIDVVSGRCLIPGVVAEQIVDLRPLVDTGATTPSWLDLLPDSIGLARDTFRKLIEGASPYEAGRPPATAID